jgi:hypothetical protein
MLAKINELNRNVVILLSVGIIAVTAIVITLITVPESGNKADLSSDIETFQNNFESEYGVKPQVSILAQPQVSEEKTEALAEEISDSLGLSDVTEDDSISGWFNAENKDAGITLTVFPAIEK